MITILIKVIINRFNVNILNKCRDSARQSLNSNLPSSHHSLPCSVSIVRNALFFQIAQRGQPINVLPLPFQINRLESLEPGQRREIGFSRLCSPDREGLDLIGHIVQETEILEIPDSDAKLL